MKCFLAIAVLSMRALICCKANRDVDGRISVESDIISFESNTRAYLRKGDVSMKYPTIPNPPIGDFGQDLPEELKQSQLIDPLKLYEPRDISLKHSPTGKFPNLVLMLRFSDHIDRELPTREDISRLYNSEEVTIDDTKVLEKGDDPIPTGSVRQWYFSNSHSTFTIDTTVVGWIDLPNTEKYYADGQHGLSKSKFKEAMMYGLNTLDGPDKPADFDFSNFDLDTNGYLDGFGVLTSGYGAEFSGADCFGANPTERIWSHKGGINWKSSDGTYQVNRFYVSSSVRGKCKSNIVRIGVLCHELGHYLGVPDLYDPSFKGNGLGAYDVMSQSWGFSGGGVWPPNLSAWSKLELSWATTELIEHDGTFEAPVSNSTSPYKVFKITHGFKDGEYLLLENRQPLGYDSKMPGMGGIAIYHVDENQKSQKDRGYPSQEGWPQNGKHYKVALLEASGKFNLEEAVNQGDEGDLWHAGSTLKELIPGNGQYPNTDSYQGGVVGTGVRIFGFSDSGAMMTFQVEGLPQGQTADATEEPTSSPTHSPTKCEEIEISTNHCDLCNEALEKIKSNEDEERKQLIARIGEMEAEIAEREMQMINMNSNNNGNGELAKELQEEMDHLKRKHERESNLMSNRIAELEDELAASWQLSSSSNDVQSRKIRQENEKLRKENEELRSSSVPAKVENDGFVVAKE